MPDVSGLARSDRGGGAVRQQRLRRCLSSLDPPGPQAIGTELLTSDEFKRSWGKDVGVVLRDAGRLCGKGPVSGPVFDDIDAIFVRDKDHRVVADHAAAASGVDVVELASPCRELPVRGVPMSASVRSRSVVDPRYSAPGYG